MNLHYIKADKLKKLHVSLVKNRYGTYYISNRIRKVFTMEKKKTVEELLREQQLFEEQWERLEKRKRAFEMEKRKCLDKH